jgi:hypothetical protein
MPEYMSPALRNKILNKITIFNKNKKRVYNLSQSEKEKVVIIKLLLARGINANEHRINLNNVNGPKTYKEIVKNSNLLKKFKKQYRHNIPITDATQAAEKEYISQLLRNQGLETLEPYVFGEGRKMPRSELNRLIDQELKLKTNEERKRTKMTAKEKRMLMKQIEQIPTNRPYQPPPTNAVTRAYHNIMDPGVFNKQLLDNSKKMYMEHYKNNRGLMNRAYNFISPPNDPTKPKKPGMFNKVKKFGKRMLGMNKEKGTWTEYWQHGRKSYNHPNRIKARTIEERRQRGEVPPDKFLQGPGDIFRVGPKNPLHL